MCLAIPGQIITTRGEGLVRSGIVRFGNLEREINLGFTPEAEVGDYVIAHVGCAISIIDEAEAEKTMALLDESVRDSVQASDQASLAEQAGAAGRAR